MAHLGRRFKKKKDIEVHCCCLTVAVLGVHARANTFICTFFLQPAIPWGDLRAKNWQPENSLHSSWKRANRGCRGCSSEPQLYSRPMLLSLHDSPAGKESNEVIAAPVEIQRS